MDKLHDDNKPVADGSINDECLDLPPRHAMLVRLPTERLTINILHFDLQCHYVMEFQSYDHS